MDEHSTIQVRNRLAMVVSVARKLARDIDFIVMVVKQKEVGGNPNAIPFIHVFDKG